MSSPSQSIKEIAVHASINSKINNIVSVIETNIKNDKTNNTESTKIALACFSALNVDPNAACPCGKVPGYSCMPCNH